MTLRSPNLFKKEDLLIYITAYNDETTLNQASQIPNIGIITKSFPPNEALKLFSN